MSIYFGDNRPFRRLMDEASEDAGGGAGAEESKPEGESGADETKPKGEGDDESKPEDGSGADEDKPKDTGSLVVDPEADKNKKEEIKPSEERNVAPEKYDLKLPENANLSDDAVKDIESFAKENNLSNEAAQKLLDREADAKQAGITELTDAASERAANWLKEAKADPVVGGDNWDASLDLANSALDELFPDTGIKEFMNQTGLGNRLEIIRGFRKIGEMLSPDRIDNGGKSSDQRGNVLDKFYNHPTSKQKNANA